MADKIEPLSDPFKSLLQSININPEQFNKELSAKKLMKAIKGSMPTSKGNAAYYASANRLETVRSVAERIQAAPRIYYPLGYVMFVRISKCKNCMTSTSCMDSPSLYLLSTDKPGTPTKSYTPVTAVLHPTLPHWIKEVNVETLFCVDCYSTELMPEGSNCPIDLAPSSPTAGSEQPQPAAPSCQE